MANKWMSKLQKLEGAVEVGNRDRLLTTIKSPSPYLNWAFGHKGHGLPLGFGMLLGGPAKGGKSFIALNFVAELHRNDPEAIAIMYNTEFRGELQANETALAKLGIDKDRFQIYDTNDPAQIFDPISKDVQAMCQEGAPIKLIIIDSTTNIQGRRAMNADTVMQQQIGDEAATLQAGYKLIMPVIRRNNIALISCTHLRDEMDQKEIMRGNTKRLAAANALKHFHEFFCIIEPNRSKDGRQTLDGTGFVNEEITDAMGKADQTGHKIRFKITESSVGIKGRTGEFTLSYENGIVNQYEEIFLMGLNTGVITKPNLQAYQFGDKTWRGQQAAITAVKDDRMLQQQILDAVLKKDLKDGLK